MGLTILDYLMLTLSVTLPFTLSSLSNFDTGFTRNFAASQHRYCVYSFIRSMSFCSGCIQMYVIMVTPSRQPPNPQGSSTAATLVFLAKILLVLLILFMLPKLVWAAPSQRRKKTEVSSIRAHCQQVVCAAWVLEESANCVNLCTSPACFEQVYGSNPLEDGEIDLRRARDFEKCLKDEFKLLRKRKRVKEF